MAENTINEATRELIETFRESNRLIAESVMAAQERNMKLAQSTFTNTVEVLKGHVEATRALMQELEQQANRQQEALRKQVPGWTGSQWMETYTDMLRAPLTAYKQALDAAEKATRQGLETFQKASKELEQATGQHRPAAHGKTSQ